MNVVVIVAKGFRDRGTHSLILTEDIYAEAELTCGGKRNVLSAAVNTCQEELLCSLSCAPQILLAQTK